MVKKLSENEGKEFFIEGEDISMQELLDMDKNATVKDAGSRLVKAVVVAVSEDDVTLDVGMKSEVFIPISEFYDKDGKINVKVGQEIEVFVLKRSKSGISQISYKKAQEIKMFDIIQERFKNNEPIEAKVVDHNKGGYMVNIGLPAFMPMSQIPFGVKKENLIGNNIDVMILEINRSNIVVSAKLLSDKIRAENAEKIKENLEIGAKLKGVVKSIKPYGAFVDIGGIDGLLHLSDMSWVRVNKPQDILSVGDELEVAVLSFDENKEKISLGLKQLMVDPWSNIAFKEGDIVEGKVKKILKNGAIIIVDDSIEGFIHISDLSWVERVHKVNDVFKNGDIVKVKVLNINKEERKISFGFKQIKESPWEIFIKEHKKDDRIFGKVTSVTDFGVFVEVSPGLEGMIHISDLSWEKTEELTKESFKKGEELEVVILRINNEARKLSLGLKQKEVDPILKYRTGKNYKGEIIEIQKDALILKLDDKINGTVPRFHTLQKKSAELNEKFEVGQILDVKLTKFDKKTRDIILSIKDYVKEREKEDVKAYMGKEENSSATFGDIFSDKLKDKLKDIDKEKK